MANEFPAIWFETFLSPENAAPVDRELGFIQRYMPVSTFRRLLDVPCGIGRHAGPLSALGYEVLGIDTSTDALAVAHERCPGVEFLAHDMFDLASVGHTFDGVICLWQSFGYGTEDRNRQMLADMRQILRPGGRILLDIYNADAAVKLPAVSAERRGGRVVQTRRAWQESRLRVEIEYSGVERVDAHEWEIYTPSRVAHVAAEAGLNVLIGCAWFDETIRPSSEHLRMQMLLERKE